MESETVDMHGTGVTLSGSGQEGAALATGSGLAKASVSFADSLGHRRQGFAVRLPRWDEAAASALEQVGGDFRIVILDQPPEGALPPLRGSVICAPAEPLERRGERSAAMTEAAVSYAVRGRPTRLLSAAEVRLLSQGRLIALSALRVSAQEVFGEGRARLELLAAELVRSEALDDYAVPLDVVLSAPDAPARRPLPQLIAGLGSLVSQAGGALAGRGRLVQAEAVIARLEQVSASADADGFLAAARTLYPQVLALLEDVYLVRALAERTDEAVEVLALRAFIEEAQVPRSDGDLWLDRCIALEQLHFANVVTEPQRLNAARAAVDHFRGRYRGRYESHHKAYWKETARLRARLLEERAKGETLGRLNTLTELGPPVGEGALEAYRELLEETSGCTLIVGVEKELAEAAVCPACRLRLEEAPPAERALEIKLRIEKAIARQMARLSSIAVRQILERSGDARVDRFVKVTQASQISSLSEILDDELVGYLRRLLVEWRIGSVLEPLLTRVQEGSSPKTEEAQESLRELARVLQRAFRGRRALPAARQVLEGEKAKKRGA